MKIYPLTSERLQNIPHDKIIMEFMSNIVEGNKEVKKLIPEIKKIDLKIGKLCEDIFERAEKARGKK